MKGKELMEVLKDKEDFEIVLYESLPTKEGRPIGKEFKLQLEDIGYSEKVVILGKV